MLLYIWIFSSLYFYAIDGHTCVCAAFTTEECEELIGCQWRELSQELQPHMQQMGICRSNRWYNLNTYSLFKIGNFEFQIFENIKRVEVYDEEDGPKNSDVKIRVSSLDWPWSVLFVCFD